MLKEVGNYQLFEELGSGSFSSVRRGIDSRDGRRVAVKMVSKNLLSNPWIREQLRKEVEINQSLSHPSICQMIEVFQTESNFYLVLPYYSKGDLLTAMDKRLQGFSEDEARTLFRQMLDAVNHLHGQKIAHRDLKPENFLFDERDRILLCDFGFATQVTDLPLFELCGSPHTVAPEVVWQRGYRAQKADMWALGVVLFYLVSKRYPYPTTNLQTLGSIDYQQKPLFPSHLSEPLIDLLTRLLTIDPSRRITCDECIEHPWMLI
jgi:serine/threonine protein kinase